MDGIYHDSHALEGGSETSNGSIESWYPDSTNRKILVCTLDDVQLWDMDGAGFDRTVFSGRSEIPIGMGTQRVYADSPLERFFVANTQLSADGHIYDYDGNVVYTLTNDAPIGISQYGTQKLKGDFFAGNDGYVKFIQKEIIAHSPVQEPAYTPVYGGQMVSAYQSLIRTRNLSDDNVESAAYTTNNLVIGYVIPNSTGSWRETNYKTGTTKNRASSDQRAITGYAFGGNAIFADAFSKIEFRDIYDLNLSATYVVGLNNLNIFNWQKTWPIVIRQAANTLYLNNGTLWRIAHGKDLGDGVIASSGLEAIPHTIIPNTNWAFQIFKKTSTGELVYVNELGVVVGTLRSAVPEPSTTMGMWCCFSGAHFYFNHISGGNHLISRININTFTEETIVELTP